MVAAKRKRSGEEYNEDDKLKHQATKALTKEAKRVKTFLLQQAIRKSKAAAEKKASKTKKAGEVDGGRGTEEEEGEEEATPCPADGDASGGLAASSQEVLLIKSLEPLAVVKICLRRLGLAHTGVEGEVEVEVGGSDQLRKLVGRVVEHKRIAAVLQELQDRVTLRRREKLAESEGRSLPGQGKGRAARSKGKAKKTSAAAESNGQQVGGGKNRLDSSRRAQSAAGSAFVSLSGESPDDDEEPSRNYYTKDTANASAGAKPKRWKPDASAAGKTSKTTKVGSRASSEPGWAGADRAAGWGRGGGRSNNGGRVSRGGRGGRAAGSTPGRQQEGRGGGAGRGRGFGARTEQAGGIGGGGGGRGGGGDSNREVSRAGTVGGEALHGSWAAKRALKEKEASATAAFSGKRTTFGDDDD